MKNSTLRRVRLTVCIGASVLTLGSIAAHAQTPTNPEVGPGVTTPGHPRVNEVNSREARQQARINAGAASGQLNANETARLQQRENNIQARESRDLNAHNGHLTRGEQRRLNRSENRTSRAIYRHRHN